MSGAGLWNINRGLKRESVWLPSGYYLSKIGVGKMIKLNKILVPTDFSEGAGSAYPVANELIDNEKGKIDFIHVIPTLKYFNESLKRMGVPLDMNKDVYPKVIEEAEEKMNEVMNRSFSSENIGEVVVRVGQRPAEVIASYAQENEYGMVVWGVRGKE